MNNKQSRVCSEEAMLRLEELCREFHKLPEEERRKRLRTGLRRSTLHSVKRNLEG